MAIAAVYISATQFSVVGEHTSDFQPGQKVQLINIGGSSWVATVSGVTFSAQSNASTVTVAPAVVAPTLSQIKLGLTYALATGLHFHHDDNDGGSIPSSDLSEAQVTALQRYRSPLLQTAIGSCRRIRAVLLGKRKASPVPRIR